MSRYIIAILLIATSSLSAQTTRVLAELESALIGSWAGTLEYRDYSEPAPSSKRVKLPTWLTIEATPDEIRFRYTYDDGPSKTVNELQIVHIDTAAATYQVVGEDGKARERYAIAGLSTLREGRGTLTLTGPGSENNAPVEKRTILRIGRNILEINLETAPAGQPFAFRHAYTMVRTTPGGK
jgi:hypothetical protein